MSQPDRGECNVAYTRPPGLQLDPPKQMIIASRRTGCRTGRSCRLIAERDLVAPGGSVGRHFVEENKGTRWRNGRFENGASRGSSTDHPDSIHGPAVEVSATSCRGLQQ